MFSCEKVMLGSVSAIFLSWGDKCEDDSKDAEDAE